MNRMMKARHAAAVVLDKLVQRLRPAEEIPGPYPVKVRKSGMGAVLAVDSLVETLVLALMTEVAEDPEGVAAEAQYLVQTSGPEFDYLMEKLVERLGGAEIRVYGSAARRLADRLNAAAGPVPFIPRQQGREAA